jgi:hypothetical protein
VGEGSEGDDKIGHSHKPAAVGSRIRHAGPVPELRKKEKPVDLSTGFL